ncbi:TRAP transporter substrate-binding protein DctP [Bacillaceae bacterium IKA-2]|nr:TRAP transporter substrate-binding protein DctP [Bacillaceae bacterium IKA-2]
MGYKKLLSILLVFVVMLLAACSANDSSGDSDSSNQASSGETFEWRLAAPWGGGGLHIGQDERFADLVEKLSNGRLSINVHQVGEITEATGVLEAVRDGVVEMGSDTPLYWSNINPAFDLLSSQVVGLTNMDYLLWMYNGGGLDMYNEIYGQQNAVYFPHTVMGMESGIRSTKPINTLDDLQGMNIRFVGLMQSRIISEFGANPVGIPTVEIYEGLQRGVIDAAEFATPSADEMMGLHEVTDYWSVPGWHQTATVFGVMINKDAWNSLPDDLKEIVAIAAETAMLQNTTKSMYDDAVTTNSMIDDHGITVTTLPDSDMTRIEETTKRVRDEIAAESEDFAMVLESQISYLEMYSRYREIQGDWGHGSHYKSLLD